MYRAVGKAGTDAPMPQLKYCRSYSRECGKRSAPLGGRGATRRGWRRQGHRRPAVAPGGGGRVDIEYDDIPDPTPQRTTATTLLFAPTVRTTHWLSAVWRRALESMGAQTHRRHTHTHVHARARTHTHIHTRIHACPHVCPHVVHARILHAGVSPPSLRHDAPRHMCHPPRVDVCVFSLSLSLCDSVLLSSVSDHGSLRRREGSTRDVTCSSTLFVIFFLCGALNRLLVRAGVYTALERSAVPPGTSRYVCRREGRGDPAG